MVNGTEAGDGRWERVLLPGLWGCRRRGKGLGPREQGSLAVISGTYLSLMAQVGLFGPVVAVVAGSGWQESLYVSCTLISKIFIQDFVENIFHAFYLFFLFFLKPYYS